MASALQRKIARAIAERAVVAAIAMDLSLVLLAGTAAGQEQTAAIRGVVRDVQRGVLTDVVVLVSSGKGLAVETETDRKGEYRLPALPPGRYEVRASRAGFDTTTVSAVDLALGVELTIDLAMRPAGPSQVIDVVSEAPRLAVTQASRATSLRGDAIDRLPRGRDFTSLAVQAPGTNDERKLGGISIDGSSGAENRIVIDGAETTDTWIGTPGQFLVTEFVEELQVKSSGYSAEFGGSTGGVLNVVTKSGSNAWHGQTLLLWSGDVLDAGPRPTLQLVPADPTRAEYVSYPEDDYTQLEPGFTIGGPIVRDRAWLFAGYVPSMRSTDRTLTFLDSDGPSTFTQRLERHHAAGNVTSQFGPRWRARAAVSTGWQVRRGLLPNQDGTGNPDADYGVDEVVPNYSASASVDFLPSARAYVSARSGYFFRDTFDEGVYQGDQFVYVSSSLGLPGVPDAYRQPRGFTNVPSNRNRDRTRGPHFNLQVDGTLVFAAAGRHLAKLGLQLDRVGIDALEGATGNSIDLFWGLAFAGVRGPYGYYSIGSNDLFPNRGSILKGKAAVTNLGLFLQDAWSIGRRLTVHAGIRTENEHVPSLSPDPGIPSTAIRFGFGDKLAPRLGLAWDVTGNGQTKVYGSWGMFYDITKLQLTTFFGGVRSQVYVYTLDSGRIDEIVDNAACPPACPGTLIIGPVSFTVPLNDPADNRIASDLDQMRQLELVIGAERSVTPTLTVSARYVHKWLDRALEDLTTQGPGDEDLSFLIANPGFGMASVFHPGGGAGSVALPKAKRDYNAVEIAADRRLSNRWLARATYTWSRLSGNYSGLAQSDENGRVAPNIGGVFDYPLQSFDERGRPIDGVLATDRPHQVKVHGLYEWPFGTSVGLAWFGSSGIPRTRHALFNQSGPVMYRGRNSDGRLPFWTQLDLHLRHDLRLGPRYTLALSANVTNLLNQDTSTNYYPNELFPGQSVSVDEEQFVSGGVDTSRLIDEQQLARDARFLMDSAFRTPRLMRVGISFSF